MGSLSSSQILPCLHSSHLLFFFSFSFFCFISQNRIFCFSTLSNQNHHLLRNGSLEEIEESLARARDAINKAARSGSSFEGRNDEDGFIPRGPIYRNPQAFYQSHIEMEKRFKIWVYKEGDQSPLFHQSAINLAYAIEGQFIDELENGNRKFLAKHPDEAVTFFLPIGVTYIIMFLNQPGNYDHSLISTLLMDYINVVSDKYEYWNRSKGFDHFFVGCHDWSPDISADKSKLFKNLIRVICNANVSEGFNPSRDATLPEIKIPRKKLGPPLLSQDQDPNNRTILAFFAGGAHGYVRDRLHQYWKDKDDDIKVYRYLPISLNYTEMMRQSKFCLCASGYEVATPRVTESIYAGCVPVLISDGFVPPYSDVLDWSQFSVHIPVARIPEIKSILEGISPEKYLEMQKNVFQVQRHFILHRPAQPFDMFHMILHSIWLRRLNVRLPTT